VLRGVWGSWRLVGDVLLGLMWVVLVVDYFRFVRNNLAISISWEYLNIMKNIGRAFE